MIEKRKITWFYVLSALFILLNGYLFTKQFYFLAALPFLILIVFLALFSVDQLILLVVFLTPFSVNLQDMNLVGNIPVGANIPTEPILFGIMLLFLMKILYEGGFEKDIMRHPITWAIMINLIWIFITAITSQMPLVSFKFLVSRLWFVIPFYFMGTQIFKNKSKMKKFHWLYIISLTGVIIYTLVRHAKFHFAEKPAHWVMTPFYNDHTAYGALIAMFLPILVGFVANKNYKGWIRIASFILTLLYVVALILSYTRAAWVSVIAALLIFIAMSFRIRFRTVIISILVCTGLFFLFKTTVIMKLDQNKQDTSQNFSKQIQSISNISSDASNLERLNRWSCAWRMFLQKPFFGWGPGTYSFEYAPFQLSSEKTIISTDMGDKGNAHSEYLGPLSESGVLGALTFIVIMLISLSTGFKLYYNLKDREMKILVLIVVLGLVTYFVHGGMNDFLDTDKASVPFWAFIGMITAIDVYYYRKQQEEEKMQLSENTATE